MADSRLGQDIYKMIMDHLVILESKEVLKHKKRKLQAKIADEHRCNNAQQNFNKQNSATHQNLIHYHQEILIN